MAAVTVVAIAFGAEMTRRRSVSYRDQANRYALIEADWRRGGEGWDRTAAERKKHLRELEAYAGGYGGRFRESWKPLIDPATQSVTMACGKAEDCYRRAAYWGALRVKYDRAARRPWLPVEPDPPRPDG
jgi:hypothetical protein